MKKLSILVISILLSGCQQKQPVKEETIEKTTEKVMPKEPTKPEETEIWEPVPPIVSFSEANVPSDAIVLFNGTDLSAWESVTNPGQPAPWSINEDGSMTVVNGTGDIQTKQNFGSIQLHIEWRNPKKPKANGQNRGNSGIFFQDRYEVQVLDSYQNETYVNGQAASVYKQHAPLANASKPSGEWQSYDIVFHAPEFDAEGRKTKSGTLTVFHNGVLVQDHVEILGTTEYIGWPKNEAHGDAPLKLQDHNDESGVSYRNIWLRKL